MGEVFHNPTVKKPETIRRRFGFRELV